MYVGHTWEREWGGGAFSHEMNDLNIILYMCIVAQNGIAMVPLLPTYGSTLTGFTERKLRTLRMSALMITKKTI